MVHLQIGVTSQALKLSFLFLFNAYCHREARSYTVCASQAINTSIVNYSKTDCTATVDQRPENMAHPEFLSVFSFPRTPVLNVDCLQVDPLKWIQIKKPVLLKNCTFFNQALKWDLDYLAKELTDEYSMSLSKSRKFLYYNTAEDYETFQDGGWKPPYNVHYQTFEKFLEIASELAIENNGTHAYFQTLLVNEDRNSSVKDDLNNFDYSWLIRLAFELGWSTNVINMLFVGMPNVLTQAHYDMMENLFIQVRGKKRFILFSPDQFSNLYPYPVGHPHDRQSQVDFDNPDFQRFPKFRHVRALEAILEPGDLLYLPTNWWHHVESYKNNFTVSLNFWFEHQVGDKIVSIVKESASSKTAAYMTPAEDLAFKRHIESMVYNVTKSLTKVKEIFEDLLSDRF